MPSVTISVRGILFDMDGVLISSTGADERCWLQWAKHHGMEGTFSLQSTHGRRALDTLRAIRPDLDPVIEQRRLEDYDAEDHSGLIILPGVEKLLASLPADRWTIVTSATVRLLEGRLGYAKLPMPAVLVSADKVANGKPHPEPYRTGAKLLGFAPADCLVIEDSPAGVVSGKAAGSKVLAVLSSHSQSELAGADWFVASLEQVSAALQPDSMLNIQLEI
ncbi:MAG TPA: HAD family hydrolase [Acidobacteriaceae bacterium]|jgi:sugar-phosphatase